MKDSLISKLLITKTRHSPTQFKTITDTLPVLCADKNFQGLNEVLWTGINLVETNFMPTYPHTNQWSITHHVQVSIGDPTDQEAPKWLAFRPFLNDGANTRFWHKSPEGVTIGIQTEFQEQASRVHKVPCQQEGSNHNHIWTVQWSNQNQNCSWSNLHSGPSSRKSHQVH